MAQKATIGHTAVRVKDIAGMVPLLEDLLGFRVHRTMGEGAVPSNVWFEEGLQLVHDPAFEGPEGRLHHLGIVVADREAMARVLRVFISRAVADPALIAFAADQRVTTHYTLTDLDLAFYLRFWDGAVTGELGAPPDPAEVALTTNGETLDGMLTGRVNAMRAALSGALIFGGEARLAMGVQRIQKDLLRLYSAAREQVIGR